MSPNCTVWICYAGGAGLASGPARHEPDEVHHGLLGSLLLVLLVRQALLEELVDDEVYDGLTDPPPRGGQTLPEAEEAALSVDPPDDHGKVAVGPVELQPGLDQPDGISGTGTNEAYRENNHYRG